MVIHGGVQGVFFRRFVQEKAQEGRVVGKVWNQEDGSVGVICEGNAKAVQALVEACHQGPPRSRVTEVKILVDTSVKHPVFTVFQIV